MKRETWIAVLVVVALVVGIIYFAWPKSAKPFKAYVVSPVDGQWCWWESMTHADLATFQCAGVRVVPEWDQSYVQVSRATVARMQAWLDAIGVDTTGVQVDDGGALHVIRLRMKPRVAVAPAPEPEKGK